MPEITVERLSKTFGTERALNDVAFAVRDQEFLTLLGPSGCGKSTTLMSVAGFQTPDTGRITCGERTFFDRATKVDLAAEDRNLGMVFQSYAVWPHMTVAQNVGFPLKVRKQDKAEIRRRVGETLELVEMGAYAARYPHELSGGQQQRVALARALVYSPSVLLLDEPFSNLDAKLRERARVWLKGLQTALGLTTVFVTHDQDEALSLSDRILVMDHGNILQAGTPEDVYHRPDNRFVAQFLGQCNVLTGRVVADGSGGPARVAVDGSAMRLTVAREGLRVGDSVAVALRPEAIRIGEGEPGEENVLTAVVRSRAFLGDHYTFELDAAGLPLSARHTEPFTGSTELTVQIPPDACHLLADEGPHVLAAEDLPARVRTESVLPA